MNLDTFLYGLHFDVNQVSPPDWEVDWEDAPFPFKLYRGLPGVELPPDVPLTLEGKEVHSNPALREVSYFLWYAFGLTQCQCSDLTPMPRRFVPSGGALYPSELYIYLKTEDLPFGVYHYDVAHHRLVLLREGDFDSYIARALGNRCDLAKCFSAVFVSTLFWKNFFKYHNFSYRLQGLDAGVLIGQLLEVAKRFGFTSGVYFQFLDRAVNHLLGLSDQEETVYAVIPLSVEPETTWFMNESGEVRTPEFATELCRELRPIQHNYLVRSQRVAEYPMLIAMNEAAMLESTESFRQIGKNNANHEGESIALPPVHRLSYDLASVCRKRYSPEVNFFLGHIDQTQLATLLSEASASFSYRNDLDGAQVMPSPRVSLYGCFYGIDGIPNGAYYYDGTAHALHPKRFGDHRLSLQEGMTIHNVNLFQVPVCLHVAGNRDHLKTVLGYRGYRIQHMEAGMFVQRLLLAACATGMGGRPLLGFDAASCDEIYRMQSETNTSLIQIPVGPHRPSARLVGGLHG